MPSINNFFGTNQTKGKIFYQENLQYNLKLIITQQYIYRGNDVLVFEVGICNDLIKSASGVQYYHDAYEWMCDNEDHIAYIVASRSPGFYPVVPEFESKPNDLSFISESGFLIKRCIEELNKINNISVWKYVWRVEMGQEQLFKLIKT